MKGNDDQELLDSTISLLSDREIPQSLETQLQERGLEVYYIIFPTLYTM